MNHTNLKTIFKEKSNEDHSLVITDLSHCNCAISLTAGFSLFTSPSSRKSRHYFFGNLLFSTLPSSVSLPSPRCALYVTVGGCSAPPLPRLPHATCRDPGEGQHEEQRWIQAGQQSPSLLRLVAPPFPAIPPPDCRLRYGSRSPEASSF